MNKNQLITIVSIIINIIFVLLYFYKNESCNEIKINYKNEKENNIYVDIEGEIKKPGVYKMINGNRIKDIITKAKGITSKADTELIERTINKAEILIDEQKIYIPAKSNSNYIKENEKTNIININIASIKEIITLPGIGESYAQKIIELRPYTSVEQIKNVPGIGDRTFENIKDLITI